MLTNSANSYSERTLSIGIVLGSAAWGFYWLPLRSIEATGMSGVWSVVFFNACPLILLLPLLLLKVRQLQAVIVPTVIAAFLLGLAFTCYANGLVETTVVRATLLYYLTPIWSTIIGVVWLSEPLTRARVVAVFVAFAGLYLLLANGEVGKHPLNIGDFYSLLAGIFWALGLAGLKRCPDIPIAPLTAFTFIATTCLSALFALGHDINAVPDVNMLMSALPTAMFWSIIVLLPCFFIIFRVSQILFPGRVAILTMSEVVVAVISASILLPGENMLWIQWLGAFAIVAAGLIEVVFGYTRKISHA